MTKYERIANAIRKRIKAGEYPAETLLPNQTDLVEEFGVSRVTIKKAINILMMEGLVYSQRGAGTRVLAAELWRNEDYSMREYDGLSQQMSDRELRSQIIYFDVEFPNEQVQKKLMINARQPVYKIIRLRIVDNEPYVLEYTYMPTESVVNLTEEILKESVYKYIHQELGLSFSGAYRNIRADRSDEYDQQYLECDLHDPVLEVEQVVYLKDGRPIDYSRFRHRYDRRSYSLLDVIED